MSIYSDRLGHIQVIINCWYSVAQMCTWEDTHARLFMHAVLDDVMSQKCCFLAPYFGASKWNESNTFFIKAVSIQMMVWIPNFHATWHLNSKPFHKQTIPHDLTTKLVRYSDPHSIYIASYVYCMLNKTWYSYLIFLWKQKHCTLGYGHKDLMETWQVLGFYQLIWASTPILLNRTNWKYLKWTQKNKLVCKK